MQWFWILYIIALSTASTLLIKTFTTRRNFGILVLIILFSLLSFYGYYKLFSSGGVGVPYAIITGAVIVTVAVGAALFYKEKFTWWTVLGMVLIVSGIIVLGWKGSAETDNARSNTP